MSASSFLPKTTDSITQVAKAGEVGITTPKLELPVMPAVASGDQVFENRMSATQALMQVGSGNLMGGGRKIKYKTHRNHIKKVMKGCNSKRTKKYKKNRISCPRPSSGSTAQFIDEDPGHSLESLGGIPSNVWGDDHIGLFGEPFNLSRFHFCITLQVLVFEYIQSRSADLPNLQGMDERFSVMDPAPR
mgnify:CR=1 FL=1